MAFTLSSAAFGDGQHIPPQYTCQGADRPPPLQWSGAPPGTRAFALMMTDIDAPRGPWTHWTWWDLPANVSAVPEGVEVVRLGACLGMNSALTTEYHGPCPPDGVHRYVFTLHALVEPMALPEGTGIVDASRSLMERSIATAQLTGLFG